MFKKKVHEVELYLDALSKNPDKKKPGKKEVLAVVAACGLDKTRQKSIKESKDRKEVFTKISVENMSNFTLDELLQVFEFLESLRVDANKFFVHWENAMAEKLNGNVLLNLLNGYAQLNRKMSDYMLFRWTEEAEKTMSNFDENDLIFVITGFSKIEQKPRLEFFEIWVEALTKKEKGLRADHIMDLFHGCSKLSMRDPIVLIFLERLIGDCHQNEIRKMTTNQLIQMMEDIGQLRINPMNHSDHYVPMWFDRVQPKLIELDKKTLTRLGWIMSRSKVEPPDQTFGEDWAENVEKLLEKLTTKELAMTLDGMVAFWMTKTKYGEFHEQWNDLAAPKLKQFWPQKLAPILYQLHQLGSTPEDDFISDWLDACRKHMSFMYIRDLVYIMEGLAAIGREPEPDFLNEWMKEAKKICTHISPQQAQYLQKSMNKLQIEMPMQLKKYVDRAAAMVHEKETSQIEDVSNLSISEQERSSILDEHENPTEG